MGADLVPNKGRGTSSPAFSPQTLHKPMNNETPDSNFPLVRAVVGDLGWKSVKAQGFLCWGPCPEEAPASAMRFSIK